MHWNLGASRKSPAGLRWLSNRTHSVKSNAGRAGRPVLLEFRRACHFEAHRPTFALALLASGAYGSTLTNVVIRVGRASRPSRASSHLLTLRRFTKRPCLLAVAEQMYARREAERWTGGTPIPLGLGAEGAFECRNSKKRVRARIPIRRPARIYSVWAGAIRCPSLRTKYWRSGASHSAPVSTTRAPSGAY